MVNSEVLWHSPKSNVTAGDQITILLKLIPHTPMANESMCCSYNHYRHGSWWRHQMATFSTLLAICAGNSPLTGEFPAQRPVTRALMFSLICAWIDGWVNNGEAGDLRRHRTYYDVTVMMEKLGTPSSAAYLCVDLCHRFSVCMSCMLNSLRPSDAYMRQ